ncbi:hypothetical protein OV320_2627 [Actinobacteria bacterium OV320]|jgi:uncharacterized protein (DUF983 family)|nr:hypothetical protein OV320_2627 [Actinobacteria bacterium OV320]
MLRKYLPVITSTVFFVGFGITFGILWWAVTGRTSPPWWLGVLLVAVAAFIADLAEQAVRAIRGRRNRTGPTPRHRKAV